MWLSRLPLALTLVRLVAPLLIAPLILTERLFFAGILFALAALSDAVDGWLARRLNLTGRLRHWGAILDPMADKLLVLLCLLALVAQGGLSILVLTLVFLTFVRELLMSALRAGAADQGHTLPVSTLSKAKTFFTFIAVGLIILGGSATPWGAMFLALSLILGYWAFFKCLLKVIRQ